MSNKHVLGNEMDTVEGGLACKTRHKMAESKEIHDTTGKLRKTQHGYCSIVHRAHELGVLEQLLRTKEYIHACRRQRETGDAIYLQDITLGQCVLYK